MRIIVPIKQVPETSNVKMDPDTGTIVRAGSEAVVNPLDLYAIETALQLRETHGGSVHVISMGPSRAEKAIREALAMGCDEGTLISDRQFGGADTWSTSYVLAQAIRALGEFDLVVAGERATDGDTAQVGPGIASWLDIPVATYVATIVSLSSDGDSNARGVSRGTDARTDARPSAVTVERLIEEGYQRVRLELPAVLTVVKEIGAPRLPTLRGTRAARRAEVPVFTRKSLVVQSAYLGLKGSPTKVVKIRTPTVTRGGHVVRADQDLSAAVSELVRFLRDRNLVSEGLR